MAAVRRLIVLDDGFPPSLAGELVARGRPAIALADLGLVGAADAEVLEAVTARDGILVSLHDPGLRNPVAPVAVVAARTDADRRDAVHRHVSAIAAQRRGRRRYA